MKPIIEITQEVIGSQEVNSVNARELWEALEVKQEFSSWIKHQIKSLGLEINVDFTRFDKKVKTARSATGTQLLKEYIITTNTAKHISMASRTAKGREVRDYFISCEEKLLQVGSSNGVFIHQFIKTQQETNNILLKNMEIQTKLLQTLVQNQDDKPKTITKEQMKKIRSNIFILLPIVSECQPNKSESEITRQLYTELNARFGVTSYYDIARDDFDEVIELQQSAITHWEEKRDLIHEQQKVDLRKSKQEIVNIKIL